MRSPAGLRASATIRRMRGLVARAGRRARLGGAGQRQRGGERERCAAHYSTSASGVVNFAASGTIPVASTPSQSWTTCL
jgi:hypothetical protein